MPLTEQVYFKARLQLENRFQIPKCIQRRFKLEADQYLKVTVMSLGAWGSPQTFLVRIRKDRRIVIPKVNMALLKEKKLDLTGYIINATLEPS
jgi:hypothetical protein